ncbi:MAG: hemolysin family protein [Planctomycetota bacterium]
MTGLIVIPLLLLVSAVFVAAEIALVAVRRTELEELVSQGRRDATAAKALKEDIEKPIAAIQIGITSLGLLLGWVGESSVADALRPHLGSGALAHTLAGVAILVALTALQVTLGELAPKAVALRHPRRVALLVARPLRLFSRLVGPAVWLLNGGAALVLRPFGIPTQPPRRHYSLHELALLVDETKQAGGLRAEQAEVVQKVFRLAGKTAEEVMVPLERVGMIDLEWPQDRVLDAVVAGAHTRMPVFEGDRSRIVGLVNTKDLFAQYRRSGEVRVREVLRPLVSLPREARLEEELERFRRQRLHLALVQDPGEAPVGMVTLEDMLEEIVGEIEDEHDRRGPGAVPASS